MKRILMLMLLLCCVVFAAADAEGLSDAAILTDAPPFLWINSGLYLDDGGIVMAGSDSNAMNQVVCLNADGSMRWDGVELGDSDIAHNVDIKGILPDGRMMVGIISYELGERPDPAFFAIDEEGACEPIDDDALPGIFNLDTLQVLPDGYLGGGHRWQYSLPENVKSDPMEKVLLGFDLQERWKVDISGYGDITDFRGIQLEDGFILHGGGNMADQKESRGGIMRLDRAGKVLWTFDAAFAGPGGSITGLCAAEDGGVVFSGYYTPEGQQFTNRDGIILPVSAATRLDADGNVLWSRVYEGYRVLYAPVRMGEGFALPAMDDDSNQTLLRLDGDGSITGSVRFGSIADDLVMDEPRLLGGANGDAMAYGQITETPRSESRVYILPVTDALFDN